MLWIVPLVVIGVGDQLVANLLPWVARLVGERTDAAVSGIVSVLVFGAGTDYALLLISRYREELHRHDYSPVAMRRCAAPGPGDCGERGDRRAQPVYRAVGSYSGLLNPSDNPQQVGMTLMGGGASADAMWGPPGGPLWVAHDPSKNVAQLKGVAVYAAASASGGVGAVDRLPEGFGPNITGGLIERIVADSTRVFADNAAAAGIPVTYIVRPEGSHTWGLFESEMQESWNTTIGPALGV